MPKGVQRFSVRIQDEDAGTLTLGPGTAYAPAQIFEALGVRPFVPAAAIVSLPAAPK